MNKKLWFKRKQYGWGWVPCTWEGWGVIVLFVLFQFINFKRLDSTSHSASDTVRPFLIETLLALGILIWICYVKGEKPKWCWGDK